MGFGFDGSGSLLAEPTGGLFAGDAIAYDPEERLVSVTQGSSTLLANAYDGAGMRAIKTAGAGTVYFLDDASGAPVVEETYTSSPTPTTTLSKINVFGADGLRQRYTVTGGGSETFYLYDPQGSVVSRIVSSDPSVQYDNEPFTDISVWDGYGQQRSDNWAVGPGAVDRQYTADDPVGFEGQAGYYSDWELAKPSNPAQYVYLTTTPSLLTHRYYDASTGRFVSRDPIGYQGGQNLYAYCGGNPVNETDPEGTDVYAYIFYGDKGAQGIEDIFGTHAMSAVDSPIGPITISYAGRLTLRAAHGKYKVDLSSLGSVYADHGGGTLAGEAYRITTTPAEDAKVLRQLAQWRGVSVKDLLDQLKASPDGEIEFPVKGHNDGNNPASYILGRDNCASFTCAVIGAAGVTVDHNPLCHLNDFSVPGRPFGREGVPTVLDDHLRAYSTNGDAIM